MDALTLTAVLRARVPLTDGEAATVAIPLADELTALHARGLGYGLLTCDDVVFEPNGRPHLAPRPAQASGTDDVVHLLRTVLAATAPVGSDDDLGLRTVLEDLLAAGCSSGQEVVDACFATVEPEPVRLPDAGALARAHVLARGGMPLPRASRLPRARRLLRAAGSPGGVGLVDRDRHADGDHGGRVTGADGVSGRRAARRRARRRVRVRLGSVAAVALVVVGAVLLRPGQAEAGPADVPVAVDPVLDRDAPAAAAAALTRQRAVALVAGTPAALDIVDLPGGPARAADEALLAGLGGDRLEGLSVDVQASDEVADSGDETLVAVTSAMSPYRRVGESGEVGLAGTAPRTVVLHLRWTDGGWRVWQVSDPRT